MALIFSILLLFSVNCFAIDLDKIIEQKIVKYQNFPEENITFRDISPILAEPKVFNMTVDKMAEKLMHLDFTHIVGLESRGFIFGAAVAYKLNKPFVMIRKPGKLPGEVLTQNYQGLYGSEKTLCLQVNAIPKNSKVVIVDDFISTGGSLLATQNLIEQNFSAVTAAVCLIELTYAHKFKKLSYPIYSLLEVNS